MSPPSSRTARRVFCVLLLTAILASTPLSASDSIDPYLGTWRLDGNLAGERVSRLIEIGTVNGSPVAVLYAADPGTQDVLELEVSGTESGLRVHLPDAATLGADVAQLELTKTVRGVAAEALSEDGTSVAELNGRMTSGGGRLATAVAASAGETKSIRAKDRRGNEVLTLKRGAARVVLNYPTLDASGPEYAAFLDAETGSTVPFATVRCIKVLTDVDLVFEGGRVLEAHNHGPDYPGAYCVWLRRTSDGWALAFNDEADVWGTMHNPRTDRLEVPLAGRSEQAETDADLALTMSPSGDGTTLTVQWGATALHARFRLAD